MSERYRSPDDKESRKDPLHVEGVPEALQIKAIDELRRQESEREGELLLAVDWNNDAARRAAKEKAYAEFDQIIRDHLVNRGISPDNEKFTEYHNYLRNHSIDNISKSAWEDGEWNDSGERVSDPIKVIVHSELEGKFATTEPDKEDDTAPDKDNPDKDKEGDDTPPDDKEEEPKEDDKPEEKDVPKTPEEIKELVEKGPHGTEIRLLESSVEAARKKLAALSAKRQGRLWTRKGSKLEQEYAEAEAGYNTLLTKLIKLRLRAEKEAGMERTEEEERLDVAFRLIEQFQKLQLESKEELANSPMGRFVTMMTTGGTFKRLLKGVALGATVGVVGAAIVAFTAGTAGGAIGAGIAFAGVKAASAARGFAAFDNKHGRGIQIVDANSPTSSFNLSTIEEAGAGNKSGEESIDLVHEHLMNKLEEDTKIEQGKRRKSAAKALGVVAVGATLVEGINLGVELSTNLHEGAHNSIFGNDQAHASGPPHQATVAPPEVAPPSPETLYSPDALTIRPGEGWYETFKALNIPKSDWSTLLEQAGPKLRDIQVDGQPLAYQMPDGQWGIRMTPDGTMPKEALDVITQTHDQMNGVVSTPAAPTGFEAPDVSGPSTAPPVEVAPADVPTPESVAALTAPVEHTSIDNIIKMGVIQPSEVTGNTYLDQFTHVATWLNPDTYAQRLGFSSFEWSQLQDHIASEVTQQHNPLYNKVFEVTPTGYLRFITSEIPDATLADMLNEVRHVRTGL